MGEEGHPRMEDNATGPEGSETGENSVALDSLVEAMGLVPGLVKVDVEGAEWYVLGGARRSIERFYPDILIEIHPGWQPDGVKASDLLSLLDEFDYHNTLIASTDICQRFLCRKTARS